MFIEQLRGKPTSLWVYLPFTIVFIGFMALNMGLTYASGIDTQEMIHNMIDRYGKLPTFILSVFPLSVLCFVLWGWVKLVHQQSLRSLTTSRNKVDFSRILFSFALWSIVLCLFTALNYLLHPDDFVVSFSAERFIPFFFVVLILIPFQTSFEEYLFRGYMMQGLGLAAGNRWVPLLITSILFGLMHGANPEMMHLGPQMLVFYIGTGLFLGILTLMDEGLELALGFHAANNIMACFLVSSPAAALQTETLLTEVSTTSDSGMYEIYFQVFIIFPILLFLFGKKYHWNNWSSQLTKKV